MDSKLIVGLAHIGIRVADYARSRAFYEKLGFEHHWGPQGPDSVAAMRHPCGVELNFIVNANPAVPIENILMDIPEKHPGITHFALRIEDVAATEAALTAAGIPLSGKRGTISVFIRDPDRNVIELATD
jgi:lactoylglutathione lyase